MSEPFLGQVAITAFDYAPKGWARCDGQFLPINQNQALFSLLGTQYGGNGITTFQLPDLRGRMPMGFANAHPIGQSGGAAAHTLSAAEIPAHGHAGGMPATTSAAVAGTGPGGARFAQSALMPYRAPPAAQPLVGLTTVAGGSQPHSNVQPSAAVNFVIALQGIFPSRP